MTIKLNKPLTCSTSLAAMALLGGAAVAPAAKPPKPPANAISLSAKPNPLSFGGYVTLSGRLTGAANSGKTVTLQVDPYPFADDGFSDKATKTTAPNGDYSFTQAPVRNNRYRVVAS